MKPSTDQVFQNMFIGLGFLVRCVSRSAMWMPLTPALLHQLCPAIAVAGGGFLELEAEIAGEIDQRLLDEPRDHAGIGAAAGDGGRAAGILGDFLAHGLAQRIVGAGGVVGLVVEVEAEPGLDHRVDVEHAELAAELHQVQRRGVDREIDAEALAFALGEQRREELLVVLLRDAILDEGDAALVEQRLASVSRGSMTVMRDLSKLKWRSMSGSVPRPIEPKPIITMGPVISP